MDTPTVTLQFAGRVAILRWTDALDGHGISPEEIAAQSLNAHARFLLVDTTVAPYTDSSGVRWLMRLQELPMQLRIAVRPKSKVRRVLDMFKFDQAIFESARDAWETPWSSQKT